MTTSDPKTSTVRLKTIGELIEHHQGRSRLTDQELAQALGYERATVIALIKDGTMRLPLQQVIALADALGIDRVDVLKAAMNEASPGMYDTIDAILDPLRLTRSERNLIRWVRKISAGRETSPIAIDGSSIVALIAA